MKRTLYSSISSDPQTDKIPEAITTPHVQAEEYCRARKEGGGGGREERRGEGGEDCSGKEDGVLEETEEDEEFATKGMQTVNLVSVEATTMASALFVCVGIGIYAPYRRAFHE
jgi:hypothetical protein